VIVRRWGEKLGFRLSPHDLRRTFTTLSLKNGAPSRLVQVAGRWSSIEMVERYSQAITPGEYDDYFPTSKLLDS
jgi:integrase